MLRVVRQGARVQPLHRGTVRRWAHNDDALPNDLAARYPRTFPRAVQRVLPLLCERGSWGYAEAWAPSTEDPLMLKCIATFSDGDRDESLKFKEEAAKTSYKIGSGVIGKAFKSRKPEWIEKVVAHDGQTPAKDFKQGLVVPAIVGDKVQAVLSFYCESPTWPDGTIVDDFAKLPGEMINAAVTSGKTRPSLVNSPEVGEGEHARNVSKKTQQSMDNVYDSLVKAGVFTAAAIYEDTSHFYNGLGLPQDYFDRYDDDEIAQHLTAFMSAKKLAASADPTIGKDPTQENIHARVMTKSGWCFMVPATRAGISEIEKVCDELRSATCTTKGMSVARFLSRGPAVPYGTQKLAVYIIDIEPYVTLPDKTSLLEMDINKVATPGFLSKQHALVEKYQSLINEKQTMLRPLAAVGAPLADGTIPVVFGMRSTTDGKMSTRGMSQLISEIIGDKLWARRKYFTTFSNGLIFHSMYFEPDSDPAEIEHLRKRVAMLAMLPRETCAGTLDLLTKGGLNAEEYSYSVCASNFAFYFLQSKNPDLAMLEEAIAKDPENAARLKRVAYQLNQRAVPHSRIDACVNKYPELVRALYSDFEATFSPALNSDKKREPGISPKLRARINKEVIDEVDRLVLEMFATFNASVLKTNFYSARKSTLSYRLDPVKFFSGLTQFTETPYGINMIMSNDFRGFHVRFMPVARGGLRLIRSPNAEARFKNQQSLFKENYSLALTQNKKNKDIPEFGSKGTILLEPSNQSEDAGRYAFMKYISGTMDLLLPTAGEVVDHLGKEEIIFCGPDEGTANMMQDAAYYAKNRGFKYWSAFTTGKPPAMGGVPHDTYGMTTRSVHQFVLGALEKAGIAESAIRKLQTGGPDGDLGSNEIKISKDVTIGIVDGSGVVFDPNGLHRDELERLAHERKMVEHFDQKALSKDGAFVSVKDQQFVLPDGSIVESGMLFRNEFHFHPLAKAELFVPCGGRPEAISGTNVHRLLNPKTGDHQFKFIIEGANLFITEDARSVLEDHGIVLYKDASTNKGGVTSSSFEVLASLAMSEEEHTKHMRVTDPKNVPPFYNTYVDEIIQIVETNAKLEFEAVHKFHEATGTKRHLATDILSDKINSLNMACQNSELWEDVALRREVLARAFPKSLQKLVGLDKMIERLPEDYLKAVFGYYIASRFVYERGMNLEGFEFLTAFFGHMASLTKRK